MSAIRIALSISAATPELLVDIESIPARHRAERIRNLASIGLMAQRGGAVGVVAAPQAVAVESLPENKPDSPQDNNPVTDAVKSFTQDFNF